MSNSKDIAKQQKKKTAVYADKKPSNPSLAKFLFGYSVASIAAVHIVFNKVFHRSAESRYFSFPRYKDYPDHPHTDIQFVSGDNTLRGDLFGVEKSITYDVIPAKCGTSKQIVQFKYNADCKGLIVLAHGHGATAEQYATEIMWFVDHGYIVLAYDATGSGRSDGPSTIGLAQSALDLDAALHFVDKSQILNDLPLFLYGHSWGGYAVATVLKDHPEVDAAVSLAGYNKPNGVVYEQARKHVGKIAPFEYPFMWFENFRRSGKRSMTTAVESINKAVDTPILIVHGTQDEIIRYGGASIIAQRAHITNPRAEYFVRDEEWCNGHETLALSEASMNYAEPLQEEFNKLARKYHDDIPDEILEEFFGKIDKKLVSQLDEDFMDAVDHFYMRNVRSIR
ncbi:MAG: lysophospholipase [Clostridiales Family XIII bacterium]|nr:lysophospholipase [Clostridiales Family XIII bacterium]